MDKTDKEWIQELMNKFQQSEINKNQDTLRRNRTRNGKRSNLDGKKSSGIISETDTDGQEGSQNPAEEEILSPLVGTFMQPPLLMKNPS